MAGAQAAASERSPAEIIKNIVANIQEIIRSEFRLARAEMSEKAKKASRAGMMLAAGGIVGLYAAAFLLVCIYNLLSYALWPWVSALLIAVVLGSIAGGLLYAGRKRMLLVKPVPEQTVETVREDVQWLKEQRR
jgi:uncharacterized membrane protein YqjE